MKQKQRKCRWIFKIILLVILVIIAFCMVSLARSKYGLENSRYEISSSKAAEDVRIVEIADLHNAVFGESNVRLVDMIKAQEPDLILMVGDMVQEDEEDLTVVTDLIKELSDTAPIYFSLGNHEEAYIKNYPDRDLLAEISAAGATILDKSYEDITVNGTDIRIGGIYGYCLPATDSLRQEFTNQPDRIAEMDWLLTYQDTEKLKLLLCHMPVCWILNGSLEYYDVDVVFAGHAHGGQVRLPFVGGLYAPDQGWFPGREEGLYTEDASTLVLTRGLGSEMKVPRFCNTPEVVTLDIYAEN